MVIALKSDPEASAPSNTSDPTAEEPADCMVRGFVLQTPADPCFPEKRVALAAVAVSAAVSNLACSPRPCNWLVMEGF